jgi:hypothetical protein
MLLTQLLTPEALFSLSDDAIVRLTQVIEAEVISHPEIRAILQKRLEKDIPQFMKGREATTNAPSSGQGS